MNRGLATLVASLAMMDPDDIPRMGTPRVRVRAAYAGSDGSVQRAAAEAKRARKAARRVREREAAVEGREWAALRLHMAELTRHVKPGASVDFVWESP